MGDDHPQSGSKQVRDRDRDRDREREKNNWLSCDHVTFSLIYYSYYKTSLIYQVKIY